MKISELTCAAINVLQGRGGIFVSFNHQQIEKKWQQFWEDNKTFKTENDTSKPKFYALDTANPILEGL